MGTAGVDGAPGAQGIQGDAGSAGGAGEQGPTGLQGAAGITGDAGVPGVAGPVGPIGPAGDAGISGDAGVPGVAGPVGPIGPAGATGPSGDAGVQGVAGPVGPTGPAGAVQTGVFAYIYSASDQVVALENDVHFDTNSVVTSGIVHAPGDAGITFVDAGFYAVGFTVSAVEANQMGLFINGVVVPGTIHGSGAGTQESTGQTIIEVAAGDVLTLRNHTSFAAVHLQSLAGGTQTNTTAAIRIIQLL